MRNPFREEPFAGQGDVLCRHAGRPMGTLMQFGTKRPAAGRSAIVAKFRSAAFALAALFGAICIVAPAPALAQETIVSEAKIARLKNALQLSSAQEVHWRALMVTFRQIVQRPQTDESGGIIQRVRSRVGTYLLSASSVQRLSAAAQPLIASLDENQKRDGMNVVREMGVAALF